MIIQNVNYWHLIQFIANNLKFDILFFFVLYLYELKVYFLIIGTKINLLPIINLLPLIIQQVNFINK